MKNSTINGEEITDELRRKIASRLRGKAKIATPDTVDSLLMEAVYGDDVMGVYAKRYLTDIADLIDPCLVLLTAADSLAELVVGEDGDEGVPTRHAELCIHLPLADKRHDRDAEQHDQRSERRTEQGRVNIHYLNLPIVHTVHDPHAQLLH